MYVLQKIVGLKEGFDGQQNACFWLRKGQLHSKSQKRFIGRGSRHMFTEYQVYHSQLAHRHTNISGQGWKQTIYHFCTFDSERNPRAQN